MCLWAFFEVFKVRPRVAVYVTSAFMCVRFVLLRILVFSARLRAAAFFPHCVSRLHLRRLTCLCLCVLCVCSACTSRHHTAAVTTVAAVAVVAVVLVAVAVAVTDAGVSNARRCWRRFTKVSDTLRAGGAFSGPAAAGWRQSRPRYWRRHWQPPRRGCRGGGPPVRAVHAVVVDGRHDGGV